MRFRHPFAAASPQTALVASAAVACSAALLPPYPAHAQGQVSDFSFFQEALSPYGEWVDIDNYGTCWHPDVEENWSPYTQGYWAYTDSGWTWVSHEPFGSIVFHYGRWLLTSGGWCWVPGADWAPAWVSWRASNSHVGWAPLPPEVPWHSQRGIRNWVDVHTEIGPAYYRFCAVENFSSPSLVDVLLRPTLNLSIILETTNITNISSRQGTVFCGGPQYRWVNQFVSNPVPVLRLTREENVRRYYDLNIGGNFGTVQNFVFQGTLVLPGPQRVNLDNMRRFERPRTAEVSVSRGWYGDPHANERLRSHFNREWEEREAASRRNPSAFAPAEPEIRVKPVSAQERRVLMNEAATRGAIIPPSGQPFRQAHGGQVGTTATPQFESSTGKRPGTGSPSQPYGRSPEGTGFPNNPAASTPSGFEPARPVHPAGETTNIQSGVRPSLQPKQGTSSSRSLFNGGGVSQIEESHPNPAVTPKSEPTRPKTLPRLEETHSDLSSTPKSSGSSGSQGLFKPTPNPAEEPGAAVGSERKPVSSSGSNFGQGVRETAPQSSKTFDGGSPVPQTTHANRSSPIPQNVPQTQKAPSSSGAPGLFKSATSPAEEPETAGGFGRKPVSSSGSSFGQGSGETAPPSSKTFGGGSPVPVPQTHSTGTDFGRPSTKPQSVQNGFSAPTSPNFPSSAPAAPLPKAVDGIPEPAQRRPSTLGGLPPSSPVKGVDPRDIGTPTSKPFSETKTSQGRSFPGASTPQTQKPQTGPSGLPSTMPASGAGQVSESDPAGAFKRKTLPSSVPSSPSSQGFGQAARPSAPQPVPQNAFPQAPSGTGARSTGFGGQTSQPVPQSIPQRSSPFPQQAPTSGARSTVVPPASGFPQPPAQAMGGSTQRAPQGQGSGQGGAASPNAGRPQSAAPPVGSGASLGTTPANSNSAQKKKPGDPGYVPPGQQ